MSTNATIAAMTAEAAKLNARMKSYPPRRMPGNQQSKRAEWHRRFRELCDELGLEPDWDTIAKHAQDAREECDRFQAACDERLEIDGDDLEHRCGGRLPLAEI